MQLSRPWDGTPPSIVEAMAYLGKAIDKTKHQDGLLMIDTAPSYGDSEAKIGAYFYHNPQHLNKAFLATKWGQSSDYVIDHSIENLQRSFDYSLKLLPRIDLLSIHMPTIEVLKDNKVIKLMKELSPLVGVSISDEDILDEAIRDNLLDWIDVIQMKAPTYLNVARVKKPTIVNSPVRKGSVDLLKHLVHYKVITLTGTWRHLDENFSIFSS